MNKTITPSVGIASRDHSPSLPKKIFSSIAHGKIGNFLGKWVLCGVRNTPTQRKSVQEEISRFDQIQEEINHFDKLPVEIGLKIFENLPDKDKNNFYHLNKSNDNLAELFYEVKQPVNKATGDPFIEHTIQDGTLADGLLIKYINHHPQEVNSRSLQLAIEYKKWAIAEVLIKHGAELDVDDVITSFCSAVDNGEWNIAEALFQKMNDGEFDNILEKFAMRNDKNAVIFLLSN